MKLFNLLLISLVLFSACENKTSSVKKTTQAESKQTVDPEKTALEKTNPEGSYGIGVQKSTFTDITQILDSPEIFEGKTVAIRGIVSDVCPMRGCWLDVNSNNRKIRVKVTDGEIVFPVSAVGHSIKAVGIVEKLELSVTQARKWLMHEAEEKGESFDSTSAQDSMTLWRIKGVGAVIGEQS